VYAKTCHAATPIRARPRVALGLAVSRECRCSVTGIVGIYSDPRHVILYTSNGEARQEFSIVLTARSVSGQPTPSSESSEVRWVPEAELRGYTMDRSMRIRIEDFLSRNGSPVIT